MKSTVDCRQLTVYSLQTTNDPSRSKSPSAGRHAEERAGAADNMEEAAAARSHVAGRADDKMGRGTGCGTAAHTADRMDRNMDHNTADTA